MVRFLLLTAPSRNKRWLKRRNIPSGASSWAGAPDRVPPGARRPGAGAGCIPGPGRSDGRLRRRVKPKARWGRRRRAGRRATQGALRGCPLSLGPKPSRNGAAWRAQVSGVG